MENMFELMIKEQEKQELAKVIACNDKTEQFGLRLTEEDAKKLMAGRKNALIETKRVEFGEGILPEIILAFCDSQYINQDNYRDIILELQDIFYSFKNESVDQLTDDELLSFMRTQFEEVCYGDLEYLRETCLERYTRAVRAGYGNAKQKRLRGEYSLDEKSNGYYHLSEEKRWDREVYWEKLKDLF